MLKAGVSCDGGQTYALNVVPTDAEAGFDVRICPSLATAAFKTLLDEWCSAEVVCLALSLLGNHLPFI
jgi:aminoacylase